jgi:uncharacterized protein YjbI with pentapeptide repeats
MNKINLESAELPGVEMQDVQRLGQARLYRMKAPDGQFQGTKFASASMVGLKVPGGKFAGADFNNAYGGSIDFRNADLRGAKLPGKDWNFFFNAKKDGMQQDPEQKAAAPQQNASKVSPVMAAATHSIGNAAGKGR